MPGPGRREDTAASRLETIAEDHLAPTEAPAPVPDPGAKTGPRAGERRPPARLLGGICLLLLALIVVDRARVLGAFGLRFTDEDQSIMWLTAQDLFHGRVFAPYFYGQSYAGWIEALVAQPLLRLGVATRTALPVAAAAVGALPCLLLAAAAWRRRAPLTAAVILTGFLLLSTDAVVMASMPRGITGGLLVGSLATLLVLGRGEPRSWAVASFSLLAVVAAALNQTSLFVTVPAGLFLLLTHWRSLRIWSWGAVGVAGGLALQSLADLFYALHPGYAFHPAWPFGLRSGVLTRNLAHLGDYLGPFSPDFARSPVLPLAALAVAVALLIAKRRGPGLAAGGVAVVMLVVSLAVPKTVDGTRSIFLPYFRLYLVLPALLAYLLAQAVTDEQVRPWVNRAVAGCLVALAVFGFAWRQAHLDGEVARLTAGTVASGNAQTVPGKTPRPFGARTAVVLERCRMASDLADRTGTGLIVYAQDRVASYLCGAELFDRVDTLYPGYERRTWRMDEESTLLRTSMLVADVDDGLCDRMAPMVSSCEFLGGPLGAALLRFPAQPVLGLVRSLGIEVRPFDPAVDPGGPRSS